ncbi:MAG: 50S ribosomal protein L23 [bacterium]
MKAPITPHITEKSFRIADGSGKNASAYTFKVALSLTKGQVKKIVEREYKVTVIDINIVRIPGKARRFKGIMGRTSAIKKALVTLKKGDRIPGFEAEDTKSVSDKE